MPPPIVITGFAVIAENVHDPRQIRRDWLKGNPHGNGIPRDGHLFRCFGRFLTHRTAGIVRGEFLKTVPMNGVSAGHFVRGQAAAEQVFPTNGTVGHVFATLTIVIVQEERVNAHAAVVAVAKVFPTPDATETTIRTVVRRFLVGHPEVANVAVVFTKLDTALDAMIAVVVCVEQKIMRPNPETAGNRYTHVWDTRRSNHDFETQGGWIHPK